MQKINHNVSITLLVLFLSGLIACDTGPQAVSKTTLTSITPDTGTNKGGVNVSLEGRNIFQAVNAEDYDRELAVSVCGEPLTEIQVIGTRTQAKAPSGKIVDVIVGSTLKGITSQVPDPTQKTKNVILTRPDGTVVAFDDAFVCQDPPAISIDENGVIEVLEGEVNFDLGTIIQDPDGDPFTVSIVGLPAGLSFDPTTLIISGSLGASAIGTSNIAITVVDSNQQSQTTNLRLVVKDRNDAPVFADAVFTVSELDKIGKRVATLIATDIDDEELSYELLNGNDKNIFEINAASGDLNLSQRVNHDVDKAFTLQMRVTDARGLSDTATVKVNVVRDTKIYRWRMASNWSTTNQLYDVINSALRSTLVPQLRTQSDGQLRVSVISPSGTNTTNVYNEVSKGTFELGHTASYLYANKELNANYEPANLFFTSQPFGLSDAQQDTWLEAEGQALWDEVNAPHNLIAFRAGMSGDKAIGWFREKITSVDQLEGLKWRIAGTGARVATSAGIVITTRRDLDKPFYQALADGGIDAVRWAGPYADEQVQLDESGAIYYTGPDWAEQTASLALYINLNKYNNLPIRLQEAIQKSSNATTVKLRNQYKTLNTQALNRMRANGVTIYAQGSANEFPQSVLDVLKGHADSIQAGRARQDSLHAKVYDSWKKFR